jgi:6-phosphogluconolactonase
MLGVVVCARARHAFSLSTSSHKQPHPSKWFYHPAACCVNPRRQEGPHAHCTLFVESGGSEFAYVVDLGLDRVFSYRLDPGAGKLTPTEPGFVKLPDGSGPRHLAIDKSSGRAYVCGELDSTLNTLRWDRDRGFLEPSRIAAVSTLPDRTPEAVRKDNSTAEVVVVGGRKPLRG